ncbi:hypothetical protein GIB67_036461 [Kingdonia uniflora]|uniref:CRIB domain-containing protein n=1 Tax=Kingdonia uniflora TaxID=39325 RepID=A0A7J7MH60_9MAGN|nr:hypothetical protein GIB67_036461 [Kingdonia uniflora]
MDIGWPTNVQHITHVTFDRFEGFLGLPVEFEVKVPCRALSISASVFGVSTESIQCSFDSKGNSVPTILLLMQERLYSQGLKGVFRINPENNKEEHVRDQLNRGIVPDDIDVHCLAGLIKAWFRELLEEILNGLSPEEILQYVVEEEDLNKMNTRNITMAFAPNMTQMSDPLTALIHTIQVMNLLKTLIIKTLREREEIAIGGGYSPFLSRYSDRQTNDDSDSQQEMDTSYELKRPSIDYDDNHAHYSHSSEDEEEVDLLNEIEKSFLRQLDEKEEIVSDCPYVKPSMCSYYNVESGFLFSDNKEESSSLLRSRHCITQVQRVAEPTVIMYTLLYNFAKGRANLGYELFLAWAGWVCIWIALMLFLLAIFNACTAITKFTRIAGKLFGMLIVVLIVQEAVKGVVSEFKILKVEDPKSEKYQFQWLYLNGVLATIYSLLAYSILPSRAEEHDHGWLRSFVVNYGVPLMVLQWTALSYSIPSKVLPGVPRRLYTPLPLDPTSLSHWTIIKVMEDRCKNLEVMLNEVKGKFIELVVHDKVKREVSDMHDREMTAVLSFFVSEFKRLEKERDTIHDSMITNGVKYDMQLVRTEYLDRIMLKIGALTKSRLAEGK